MRTRVLTGPGLFEELRGPWEALVSESPTATPFQTWEWQSTWWRHFGGAKKPRAVVMEEGNDLVGVFPLMKVRGPWRTLRPMGVGPSDYLHPLARRGAEAEVARAVEAYLAEVSDVDLIDLHQVRDDKPLAATEAGQTFDQAVCLVLDLPPTYEAFLGTLSKSLRYDVRKLDKSPFKEGKATLTVAGPEDVQEAMEVLFEQHRRRWRKRGLPGAFLGRAVKFHHDWASQAVRNGWLRLGVLRREGTPIGAIYAMALGETTYFYQAGFDPEASALSPGSLLVAHTIRQAIEEGRPTFDFMRGDEGYKRRWKPQHARTNRRVLIPAKGALGRLGAEWNRTASRVEARLRAKLEGHAAKS